MEFKTKKLLKSFREIQVNTFNPKSFIYSYTFLKNLRYLLIKKGIYLSKSQLGTRLNYLVLNLELFYTTFKLNFYTKQRRKFFLSNRFSKRENIFQLVSFKRLKVKYIIFKAKVLNKFIDKNLLKIFFDIVKFFQKNLFFRRANLYFDFLKLIILYNGDKITIELLTCVLGQIFRLLSKKNHTRFFFFLKLIFRTLIYNSHFKNGNIKGIKCIIGGRIQGKIRSNRNNFQIGHIPIQSISKNIDYSKIHIPTNYGVFGLKLWVFRK